MTSKGNALWIEGSIALAQVLSTARAKFPADQEFGQWCEMNAPTIRKDDRAALIGLGRMDNLREILIGTTSRSYQLIWRTNRPELTVVADRSVS